MNSKLKKINLKHSISSYNGNSLKHDLLAAVTVTITLVPQGMAYAMLAGLPPIYGLYASFIPLLIYPLFGSSKYLSVGPVALVSIIMLSGLSQLAEAGTQSYIELAILTSLVAGVIQILLAGLRMGWLVNYLSEPVIVGFTSAAAIIIIVTQLKSIFGLDVPRETRALEMIRSVVMNIQHTNFIALLIGVVSLALIIGFKRIKRSIPGALIAVIIGTLLVYFLDLNQKGIDIVGFVPSKLPEFSFSFITLEGIEKVLPLALVICLISFIESLAIAKTMATRHSGHINANKELLGLGLAKFVGSFFQAFPNTGSFSRSAINEQSGAATGFSSIFAGLLIGLTLLFLTPLFHYLPKSVLAAIIISAITGLINVPYAKMLFKIDRKDFYVFLTTFVLTLLLGVQRGVFAGVFLSMGLILYKSSKPHYAVLGKLEGTKIYRNLKRYKEAMPQTDTLIIRYDEDIYFGNAEHFYDTILKEIESRTDVRRLIIDFSSITHMDSTGLQKFERLLKSVQASNIRLALCGVIGPVRDYFSKSGLNEVIGIDNIYLSIQDAVDDYHGNEMELKRYASQHFKN